LVRQGETGLLYPIGDEAALADAIRTLGSTPDMAARMGRAGWDLVRRNHTPEEHYEKLLAFYEGLVGAKSPRIRRLVTTTAPAPWQRPHRQKSTRPSESAIAASPQTLRVAFIGGRGVISKYSGI